MVLLSSDGSTRNFCGIIDQKNILIPIPPIEEQKKIEMNLGPKISKLDQTIYKHKVKIDLLQHYRESLISEVVTDKYNLKKT